MTTNHESRATAPVEVAVDNEDAADPDSRQSVAIATWNIRNGRANGLE
ncbi:MAG TPA: hypothetical protein V6D20_00445 [Candidatus Obscuribacterales bacterium]